MKLLVCAIALAIAATAPLVHAQDSDWIVKVGVHTVDPKSDNGTLAGGTLKSDVGSDVKPTVTAEYLLAPEWGVEVLASLPWKHDVKLNGVLAATTKQLPPTVSVQYHFNPSGKVSPFVGLGLNYTMFFSEHTTGPLAGTKLSLDDSLGIAAHGGVDFRIDERWLVTLDARWIKIGTDAKVNGTKVGTVHIDPFAYGIAVGYRF